jgi:hypothetical protein
VELEVGDVGGFAGMVVPGFVGAFGGGWFEDADFGVGYWMIVLVCCKYL